MRRISDTAVRPDQREDFVKGDGSRIDEEILFCAGDFVFFVHDLLLPEDFLPVGHGHKALIDKPVKSERVLKAGKQADHMDLFLCGQFHARDHSDPVVFAVIHGGRAVGAGIMVCQRDHIQPLYGSHAYKVCRSHIIIPAWGKAGMDVEIIIQRDHSSPA